MIIKRKERKINNNKNRIYVCIYYIEYVGYNDKEKNLKLIREERYFIFKWMVIELVIDILKVIEEVRRSKVYF